jgi:hypothetical protein
MSSFSGLMKPFAAKYSMGPELEPPAVPGFQPWQPLLPAWLEPTSSQLVRGLASGRAPALGPVLLPLVFLLEPAAPAPGSRWPFELASDWVQVHKPPATLKQRSNLKRFEIEIS